MPLRLLPLASLLLPAILLAGAEPKANFDEIRESHYAPANAAAGRTFRVFDWNIDRGTKWTEVVAAVRAYHPDLCFLQEVDLHANRSARRDEPDELAREFHWNSAFAPEFQELSQGDAEVPAIIGQASFSGIPQLRPRILRFKTQSDFWHERAWLPSSVPLFQRRNGNRVGLVTEYPVGSRTLVVYNVHLESRSGGRLQHAQVDEMIADANRYPKDTPILFVGDINSKYGVSAYTEQFTKAGFHSCLPERHPRTTILFRTLDWILIRGPIACSTAEVPHTTHASDHYPVTTTITLQ